MRVSRPESSAAGDEVGRFGPWYPLAEASRHAPAGPGVFQVRVAAGLVRYPRGRSAMIHYGHGGDVRAAALAVAAAHPGQAWLCRHQATPDAAAAAALCAELSARFVSRFGAAPAPGEASHEVGRDR